MIGLPGRLRGGSTPFVLAAVAVVAFAFWKALFAGGSLVSADIVALEPPFEAEFADDFGAERGPGDTINIHAHWGSLAQDLRNGEASWWDSDLAAGQPTMKGGLPVFDSLYLVAPTWFAPGLVAAVRALVAIGLMAGWLRAVGTARVAALVGGLAFGFSGFLVGWMNWPHSSVAALAPGLFWGIERLIADPRLWRAVPIGVVFAAMVWSNFPQVTLYVLLAAAVYAVARVLAELPIWRNPSNRRPPARIVGVGAVAIVLGVGLALPHVVGFSEYLDWADTSHRVGGSVDSAAGTEYLLTTVTPVVFGTDGAGPAWFGEGNWVEFQTYVGASVVLLALLAGTRVSSNPTSERRRRSVVVALGLITLIGVFVAYVGGPVGTFVNGLIGDEGGLATRAKVLIALGAAAGAGLGADAWVRPWREHDRKLATRAAGRAVLMALVILVLLTPSILDWFDLVQANGVTRQVVSRSAVPIVALAVTATGLTARWLGRLDGRRLGWLLVAVVTCELVSFAMPVPTIAEREQRLRETESHDIVTAALEPGERLGGEGTTFYPATTSLFGLDDVRGQLLKSEGYQQLLRSSDSRFFENAFGGTPTYPYIQADSDPTDPIWDVLAVGVWSQFPASLPPGPLTLPDTGVRGADPAAGPLVTSFVVPDGGLRAVVFEIGVAALAEGRLTLRVEVDDEVMETERRRPETTTGLLSFAIAGEHLVPGRTAEITLSATGPLGVSNVAVDAAGAPVVGWVAGADDGLELIGSGAVTLLERTDVQFARLHDAAVVEPDVGAAVDLVRTREAGARESAILDTEVGLPTIPDPDARLEVHETRSEGGSIDVTVSTDRDAVLVVSVNDYPGWRATVDGAAAEVVTADASFVGVVVPAGVHDVSLRFRPRRLAATALVAGLSALASVALLWRARGSLRRGPAVDR